MRNVATSGKRIGYGWLYNWYAVTHASGLAPDGWRVLNYDEMYHLVIDTLGGVVSGNVSTLYAAGKMKSDSDYWLEQNILTPLCGMDVHPSGFRTLSGIFLYLRESSLIITSTQYYDSDAAYFGQLDHDSTMLYGFPALGLQWGSGTSVRCVQDKAPDESDGDTGTLTDVEGNIYKWVVIGDYRWMAENLRTTKYRNGNTIPEITDNTAWANDTTGARCAYNNDHYFVYPPQK